MLYQGLVVISPEMTSARVLGSSVSQRRDHVLPLEMENRRELWVLAETVSAQLVLIWGRAGRGGGRAASTFAAVEKGEAKHGGHAGLRDCRGHPSRVR